MVKIKEKWKLVHRLLMNVDGDMVVDHINRIPSDNRKVNLRVCTFADNSKNLNKYKNNKSGVAGVFYRKDRGKYQAYISINEKKIHLGTYSTFEEAVKARKDGELKYYEEFAPL